MEILLAIAVGSLYAAGFYLILRRSLVKVIIGLAMLSHAANLFLFNVGGLTRGNAPLLDQFGMTRAGASFADPLPQALILTAIVIGFGVQAFALVLFKRVYNAVGSDDLDQLRFAMGDEEGTSLPGDGGNSLAGPHDPRDDAQPPPTEMRPPSAATDSAVTSSRIAEEGNNEASCEPITWR